MELSRLFEENSPTDQDGVVGINEIVVSDHVMPTDEFVESVRRHGIIHKPVICLLKKGSLKYGVLSGRRRILAARQLGYQEINVTLKVGMYYSDALAHVLTLEAQRKTYPNPVAEARAVVSLVQGGYTKEEIRTTLGMSNERIEYLLKFSDAPEDLLDAVQDGRVRTTTLEAYSKLSEPFKQKAVEKFRENGGKLTGPEVREVKAARRSEAIQRVMEQVQSASALTVPGNQKNISIEITKKALDHFMEVMNVTDREAAEMELQHILTLCRIRSV